jgi:hypothetical protein
MIDVFGVPDYNQAIQPQALEEFMNSNYIRPIGYTCLAIILALVILGLVTKKTGLATLGSVAFFLPTFGSFVSYMFFLAGIGLLRVAWVPIWDLSKSLLRLGDVAYLPYAIVMYPLALLSSLVNVDLSSPLGQLLSENGMVRYYWGEFHPNLRTPVAYLIVASGIMIFALGTLAWLYAKLQGKRTVDF